MSYSRLLKDSCSLPVLLLVIGGMIFIANLAGSAEEKGHVEQAPHNGQILDTGEKHVEFLVKGGKEVFVYFYDKNLKPISAEGVEGTVYFKMADNSRREAKLAPVKENGVISLKGNVDLGTGDYTEAVVSLKTGDKKENLRFGHPTGQEHHK